MGDGCYFSIDGPGGCQPAGSVETYGACDAQSDCEPRSVCAGFGGPLGVCLPMCDSTIGDSDCPGGFTCLETDIVAAPDVGLCVAF